MSFHTSSTSQAIDETQGNDRVESNARERPRIAPPASASRVDRASDLPHETIASTANRICLRMASWFAPRSALRRAYRLFCTPVRTACRVSSAEADMAAVSRVSYGNEHLQLHTWGDPKLQPCVVISHDWSSNTLAFSSWIAPLRSAGFAVVGFDQIGHGESSGDFVSLNSFADALQVVSREMHSVVAMIGHGWGATAVMLALADGLPVDRVVLIAPTARPAETIKRFGREAGLSEFLSAKLLEEYSIRQRIDIDALAVHIKAPVIGSAALVIHDLEDRQVPWSDGECYARHWPSARLLTTDGLGHGRIVDDESVVQAALTFLQGEVVGSCVASSPNLPFGVA